ncbi:MAG: SDR family oxidoreductase [Rhodobacteraceae bacterium]|nr:SDR family oxidoreductase [Paracoccaceae bacterium]
MTRLTGKIVIIAGATSGMARAAALRLCAEGARVMATGRREALGAALVAEAAALTGEFAGELAFEPHDVTAESSWAQVLNAALTRWGRFDALIINAGMSARAPIAELTEQNLRDMVAVNVEGPFLGMRQAFPLLRKSGGGLIVNVGSVAAMRPAADSTAYAATKAALTHMTMAAAAEGAALDPPVRVNMLQPGFIWSDSVVEKLGDAGAAKFRELILARSAVKRVGTVDDIAAALAFLVSDGARHLNGVEFVVDGGLSLA